MDCLIERATHCRAHGEPKGMIDVVNHRCKNGCQAMTSRNKYDGYCIRCYIHLYPDEPVARNWKTKETHVRHHISALASTDERLKRLQLTFDRALGGCSRRRPDAFIDCLSHAVVIECDENQHVSESSYPCENKRMMEIYEDIGHRPLVMLRFNPDKYVDSEGTVIPSCFQYSNKRGGATASEEGMEGSLECSHCADSRECMQYPRQGCDHTSPLL